jgi:hypothetical protein
MPSVPLTSASRPNFASIFNVALDSYRRKTKKDLASHPLLPRLQSFVSPEAILSVLQEQIPALDKTEDGFTKWVVLAVNVLHAFSGVLGQAVGLVNNWILPTENFSNARVQAFPPASIIFAGIGVLLSVGFLYSFAQPI